MTIDQNIPIPSGNGPASGTRAPGDPAASNDDDDDILTEARERFAACEDGWSNAKDDYLEDFRFARLSEQWVTTDLQQRNTDGRPALTINRMPPFIRQVVNDGRQNRPAIKVRPVGNGSDQATAEVIGGLIRHVEQISDADVAYDTGLDCSCTGGFGFINVDTEYTHDESFDLELKIKTIINPMCVSWDPKTEAADSSDWRYGFISENMDKDEFERKWPDAASSASRFDDGLVSTWYDEDTVQVSKYYERVEVDRQIVLLSNGNVVGKDTMDDPLFQAILQQEGVTVTRERTAKSMQIVLRLISGMNILETRRWNGTIIPIVPVYGDSFSVEGRRYFRSLIHDAKDPQRIHNIARSTATELVALSPKKPFIGEAGTFDIDADKWANINQKIWPYVEYKKGSPRPTREPFTEIPASAISEAQMALEDMKAIVGIHDASLGIPGNEISGKAIRYRQKEGDVSTFHFIDNQHRAIRCVGRILLEMIPQVYTGERTLRILGLDGKAQQIRIGTPPAQPAPEPPQMPPQGPMAGPPGAPPGMPMPAAAPPPPPVAPPGVERVYDLTAGKYDLAVEAGPSYTTQREETRDMATTLLQADPAAAPILGPMIVKMSDFPEAEKISDMLATAMPPAARAIMTGQPMPPPGPPPEVLAKQAEMQAQMQMEQQKAAHQAQLDQQSAQQTAAINTQKAQQEFQLAQQAQQHRLQIEQQQAVADIAVQRQKADAEMQIERERAALQAQLKREEAALAASLKLAGAQSAAVATPAQIEQ